MIVKYCKIIDTFRLSSCISSRINLLNAITIILFAYSNTCALADVDGTAPVPESATFILFGTGFIGLIGSRYGRKK